MSEEQILTDPNSPGWRYLRDKETLQAGDEFLSTDCMWCLTGRVGEIAGPNVTYRRRIESPQPQQPSDKERYQVLKIETLSDMVQQLIADRDEYKRKAAISHKLAEMSRRQVVEMAEKIQYLIDRLTLTVQSREQE